MAINVEDWGREDRYVSDYGNGPLIARILCVAKDEVVMERKTPRGRWKRFTLPYEFAKSEACGWVLSATPPKSK